MRAFRLSVFTALLITCAAMSGGANADLAISKRHTLNVDCAAGICNATAVNAVLNVKDLANMLAVSDVKVFAEGPATEISVLDPLRWVSANRLTLGAYGSLNVKAAITVAGTGGLTIATNVAGQGGAFRLVGIGKISFWDTSSSLIINSATYTLIDSLPDLIAAIAANPSGTYAFANDYNAAQDGSYPLSPIPTTFTGILEGLGNAIGNLKIYNANPVNDMVALFYDLGTGSLLSDLNLTDASIQTYGAYAATLAGINHGTVVHSSASGAISNLVGANWSAAGLVYDNEGTVTRSHAAVSAVDNVAGAGGLVVLNAGTISLSDASGSIDAASFAGGLVAVNSGTITDSYAQGAVTVTHTQDAQAGGLVGVLNAGTVQRCFATGTVLGGTAGPGRRGAIDPGHAPRKLPGIALGGLVGFANGTISYSYATGSVTGTGSAQAKRSSVGGLVGQAYTSAILQSYSLSKVNLNSRHYVGGVIGSDNASRGNSVTYWDLDTSGVENPDQGAGNIFHEKGLKGLPDDQFRQATIRNFDPSVWAENASINNGYPYLLANPPPQ